MNFKVTRTPGCIEMVPTLPLTYERRVVAFVDILGFERLVTRSESDPIAFSVVRTVQQTLELATTQDKIIETGMPFEFTQVSDSLILSFPPEKQSLISALMRLQILQLDLLMQPGVLCRGGVTIGNVIHSENAIFGPAYLEALRIEKSACTPRIVVDANAVALLEADDYPMIPVELRAQFASMLRNPVPDGLIRRDERDGSVFLDYIRSSPSGVGLSLGGMALLRTAIERLISSSDSTDVKVRRKHAWVASYFDLVLRGNPTIALPPFDFRP